MRIDEPGALERLDFGKGGGLVPVIAQHALTGEVLMLAYADREALVRSLEAGELWFLSRSRRRLWRKGESSGNALKLVSLHADCDGDAVLARVEPTGPACHTGARSCFTAPPTLQALADVLGDRATGAPGGTGYTAALLADRNLRLKKVAEEAAEVVMACMEGDRATAAEEAADLVYHVLVACRAAGVEAEDVLRVLEARARDRTAAR